MDKEKSNGEAIFHCLRKEDFDELFEFKEKMIGFAESKKTLNSITRNDINDLRHRIKEIDAKIDRLLFVFVTGCITIIISFLIKLSI